jgi:hypothetical protein
MNTETSAISPGSANREFRPTLSIYHPNARGTGCAVKMELHPAHDDVDGSIMVTLANQIAPEDIKKDAPAKGFANFARFDWRNRITVKLDFSDLCRILQVLRGECEAVEDGKGLIHTSPGFLTKIQLRHTQDPKPGFILEVYKNSTDKSARDTCARILFSTAEAYGLAMSFEASIGIICFGIPKVVPHDISGYRSKMRIMRNGTAAVA